MSRRLPSLLALRAFEAAARLGSFTKAAAELDATQSGISHHIKVLEGQVGQALFVRRNRHIELTQAGRAVAPSLSAAFDMVAGAFEQLEGNVRSTLALTVATSFNTAWLVPRLAAFQERHPSLEVRLDVSSDLIDIERGGFDAAIRSGEGAWPGLMASKLLPLQLAPLCSPTFIARHGPLDTPHNLLGMPLIEAADPMWERWFALAGLGDVARREQPSLRLKTRNLHAEAAVSGRGAALLVPALYAQELAEGRLVQPFATVLDLSPRAFWFAFPTSKKRVRPLRLLRDWLTGEAVGGPPE